MLTKQLYLSGFEDEMVQARVNIITTGIGVKSMHNSQSRRTKEEEEEELEEEEKIDFRRVSCL